MAKERIPDEKKAKVRKPDANETPAKRHAGGAGAEVSRLVHLQKQVGNRAVQRLLAQRSGDGPFELDEATAGRINRARGGGQALDGTLQASMGAATGYDFSGVRVHTSPESDDLNRQLSAKAFTTGQDVFFRQGAYDPGSSSGRELVAHELTHVVQQGTGAVGGGGRMTVRSAGDVYEQEADATAKQAANMSNEAGTQAAAGEAAQRQEMPEEETLAQTKAIQRQEMPEEEELAQTKAIQRQEMPEEEELAQTKAIQRQDIPEEDETLAQTKAIQRQEMPEEETLAQTKAIQRQEMPEEREEELPVQTKAIQRQEIPEEEP